MSNKQTAVEWLVEKMLNQDWYTYKSLEYIQQAKELEKEQAKKMYSEEDMKQYAIFCIRCYEQGLPCIIAKDWFEKFNNLNNK